MTLQILPLAIMMMAGPQIMSAIILVTHKQAVRVSLAFLAGVAVAATLGVAAATGLAAVLGSAVSLGDPLRSELSRHRHPDSVGRPVAGRRGALPLAAYLLFRQRAESAMPRVRDWMNSHSWLINILVCIIFIALIL